MPLYAAWRTMPSRDQPPSSARIDELRTDPPDAHEIAAPTALVVARWRWVERRIVLGQRPQTPEQIAPDRSGEPGPDLAGEPQLAVFIDPDGDGAEVASVAGPGGPAADHELLFRADLQLQPRVRPSSWLVA